MLNDLRAKNTRLQDAQVAMSAASQTSNYYQFDAAWDNVKSICHPKTEGSLTATLAEAWGKLAAHVGDLKKPKPYKTKWDKACKFEEL